MTETTRTLRAALFDMDGTLLDSEKIWDVALDDLATELGGTLAPDVRASMVGSSMDRSVAIMHEAMGAPSATDPATSAAFLTDRTAQLFRTDLVWKPGAQELLEAVRRAGVPAVLVTSTHRQLTEIALDTLGRENFVATVCGDEVPRPKPFPDPYLRAAELAGAPPRCCVAIEDSPMGIESAGAAGCIVVGVPSEVELPPGPHVVLRESLVGVTVEDLESLVR